MTATRDPGTGGDVLTIEPPTELDAVLEDELAALWSAVTSHETFCARHGYEVVDRLPGALRFEDGSCTTRC